MSDETPPGFAKRTLIQSFSDKVAEKEELLRKAQDENEELRRSLGLLQSEKAAADAGAPPPAPRPFQEWDDLEKVAYIQEHGIDRYREILNGRGR